MSHSTPLAAAGLVMLSLWGCARQEPVPPPPAASPAATAAMSERDPSVPDASTVFAPAAAASVATAAAGRANQTLTPKEESVAMPMPGQNNDHSAPVAPARRASAP